MFHTFLINVLKVFKASNFLLGTLLTAAGSFCVTTCLTALNALKVELVE